MSEKYIKNNFCNIKKYANIIENRLDDNYTLDDAIRDNARVLELAQKSNVNYIVIDNEYKIDF